MTDSRGGGWYILINYRARSDFSRSRKEETICFPGWLCVIRRDRSRISRGLTLWPVICNIILRRARDGGGEVALNRIRGMLKKVIQGEYKKGINSIPPRRTARSQLITLLNTHRTGFHIKKREGTKAAAASGRVKKTFQSWLAKRNCQTGDKSSLVSNRFQWVAFALG